MNAPRTTLEHAFVCPWCWESITMVLDLTAGGQRYVEDCEVCCNPIDIRFDTGEDGRLLSFAAEQLE